MTDQPFISEQTTLAHPIACSGVGLHTGKNIRMRLNPLEESAGIVFVRTDMGGDLPCSYIKAHFGNVCSTTLGTALHNEHGASVATVEHLMAALWGSGVDNCLVELDGPEVPIMDGSSEPFVFLIDCAGTRRQRAKRRVVEVVKEVSVREDGEDADGKPAPYMAIRPSDGFSVDMTIDFNDALIRRQSRQCDFAMSCFKKDISRARTFGFAEQVDYLRSKGLILGGSLENAIVLDGGRILNGEDLRYGDEFVRHKILDCVGDLYLSGGYICGHVEAYRSGHGLNNALLKRLFSDKEAWRYREAE
jgi:UDP-3-O-[3-hydroxymyristoyl] N-acetylglucosamine deacetylase